MPSPKRLHLGAFMRPVGIHTAWWRDPDSLADANANPRHLVRFAQTLERGMFDAFFMADHLAVLNMPMAALRRSATVASLDPLTLLPALAMVTEHIGLIATASTTYNEPFHIARKFASLDHISGGRAGWNLVTSGNPDEALNFGRDEHMEHDTRYRRAREFFDVVTGLWDSWADDAFTRDKGTGLFFDPDKMHVLDHQGEWLKVRGPLNVARPPQGWPVIVQAGASEAGRQIAAETAEVIFASATRLADAQAFYADVKGRMRRLGRDPDHLKVLPGAFVVVGDTVEEARARKDRLDALVHPDSGLPNLSMRLGTDVSGFDLDGPLPDIPESNASQSGRQKLVDLAREQNLTIRQLARYVGSYGGLAFVGTPATIADEMEAWLYGEGCDGFNIMFPTVPAGLDAFVDRVVPELQRRGLFRTAYEGRTLRENLGLPRPANRFFPTWGLRRRGDRWWRLQALSASLDPSRVGTRAGRSGGCPASCPKGPRRAVPPAQRDRRRRAAVRVPRWWSAAAPRRSGRGRAATRCDASPAWEETATAARAKARPCRRPGGSGRRSGHRRDRSGRNLRSAARHRPKAQNKRWHRTTRACERSWVLPTRPARLKRCGPLVYRGLAPPLI